MAMMHRTLTKVADSYPYEYVHCNPSISKLDPRSEIDRGNCVVVIVVMM